MDEQLERTFVTGLNVISQHDSTNGTVVFLYDGHGSTRALLDDAANIVETYAYDAYGNHLDASHLTSAADARTNLLYAGEWAGPHGQQYLRARWYDPSVGRFNRLDPWAGNVRDPLSLHKYLYAHGNPIMNVDPSGEAISLVGHVGAMGMIAGVFRRRLRAVLFDSCSEPNPP